MFLNEAFIKEPMLSDEEMLKGSPVGTYFVRPAKEEGDSNFEQLYTLVCVNSCNEMSKYRISVNAQQRIKILDSQKKPVQMKVKDLFYAPAEFNSESAFIKFLQEEGFTTKSGANVKLLRSLLEHQNDASCNIKM